MKKGYEINIPINKVVKLDCVSEEKKQGILKLRNSIDIVCLSEEIERKQTKRNGFTGDVGGCLWHGCLCRWAHPSTDG